MNKELKKILIMKLTFIAIMNYTTIFISYFFWKQTGDLKTVLLFNLFQWVFSLIPTTLATWMALKNIRRNYYISAIAAIATFGVLHWFSAGLEPVYLMMVVAMLTTTTSGFFYASNTLILVNATTTSAQLNRYVSLEGSISNAVNFLIPIFSGIIIYYAGYSWSFLVMLAISMFYLLLATTSLKAPSVDWKQFKQALKEKKLSKQMNVYMFFGSIASKGMVLFNSVLLILISANAMEISMWSAFSVIIVLGMAQAIKKYSRITITQWGNLAMLLTGLSILVVCMGWDLRLLILFQSVIIYLTKFVEITLPLKQIRKEKSAVKMALIYKREVLLAVSRVSMIVGLYFLYEFVPIETFFLVVLTSVFITLFVVGCLGKKLE